jgi:periplasmic protein TonB
MGTIEIHEPQVKEVKPPSRPQAAVLPKAELVEAKFTPRPMFADSVLDFGQQKKRQSFATVTSFILNCLAIGVMLIIPLAFPEGLPKAQLLTFLVAPPPPPPPPPPAAEVQRVVRQVQTDMLNTGQLRTPSRIPQRVQMIKEEDAPPPMPSVGGVVGGVPGGIPGGQLGGVIGGIVSATSNAAIPKFVPVTPQRVRISQGVTRGLLIQKVEPQYPALARAARVQGDVVLSAVIDTNGQITNLQLVSGHPMLVPAAIAAVKQWRYKPYLLNGQPVEVETTITVIFSLSS